MSVTSIPNVERDEMRAQIEEAKRSLRDAVESFAILAQYQKARYDAYIAQGFTEAQALYLCCQNG